jgi:hypothetical protein
MMTGLANLKYGRSGQLLPMSRPARPLYPFRCRARARDTGLSDYSAKAQLNWLTGQVAMPALPNVWLSLYTAVGADDNTGFTEVTGGAYARQQVAGNVATNGTTANGNATLHFASVPAWIVAGMSIYDTTGSGLIPAATTVSTTTGTTVVMSANATGAGVGSGDNIVFSAFAAPTGTGPSQATNSAATITFPQATANWGTAIAFGLTDASTSGDLLSWDYLGNHAWLPAYVTAASPAVLDIKAHGYSIADTVAFSTEYGGTAPSFSQSNFTGLLAVIATNFATDVISVSNASTNVNTSTSGSGMVRKVLQQSIPINTQASFAASSLVVVSA